MDDEYCIGCSPHEEQCAQLGRADYRDQALAECRALIRQLRRAFGPEPEGARLYIKRNSHDFGTYLTVECAFKADHAHAHWYAHVLESSLPAHWDRAAKRELGLNGKEVRP